LTGVASAVVLGLAHRTPLVNGNITWLHFAINTLPKLALAAALAAAAGVAFLIGLMLAGWWVSVCGADCCSNEVGLCTLNQVDP
jgi:hypothetical protein